jgi:uncharacterized protein (TIGR02452 family)
MGRTEKSQGLAPPAVRKDIRAKQARQIINKTIPALLASNARARRGSENSELIVDPPALTNVPIPAEQGGGDDSAYVKRKGQGRRKVKNGGGDEDDGERKGKRGRKPSINQDISSLTITPPSPPKERTIRIITTDTLTAAHLLTYPSKYNNVKPNIPKKSPNVCILNMASPLRPGGGVLTGATSQEEFLCSRTTLLLSLKESFYRLPEFGGVWSPDVLAFRNHLPLGDSRGELGPGERFWVDVVSAGMLRFPELEGSEDEVKRLSKSDRGVVEKKMRAVLRIAAQKGVKRFVLGAWGCGAYGNPVIDIAQAWRRVIDGALDKKGKAESWPFEDVVFAIGNTKLAASFAHAFDSNVQVEAGPGDDADEDEEEGPDAVAEELRTKIAEMEGQVSKVWNPDLKLRMGAILDGLRAQLVERETDTESLEAEDDEDEEDEEDVGMVESDGEGTGELEEDGEMTSDEDGEYVVV